MSESRCPFLDDASAHWDGELDDARRADFERHLATCAACRRELAAASRVDALLRAADPARVRPSTRRLARRWAIAASLAAAAVLGAAWWASTPRRDREPVEIAPPSSPVAASPPPAIEIVPAVDDWGAFRRSAIAALVACDGSPESVARVRAVVGLSTSVLADLVIEMPDDSFADASRAVVALGGVRGARAVAADAEKRGLRADAVAALGAARESEAVDVAVRTLSSWIADPELRAPAIVELARMDRRPAWGVLEREARGGSDEETRDLARRALGSSTSPDAVGALARIGDAESGAPAVAALLADRREPLARWWRGKPSSTPGWRFAAEVLARGGDRDAVSRLVSESAAGDTAAAASLARAGEGAVPRLREILGSPVAAQRRTALEALASIPGRAALDALLVAVSRTDLRERALEAVASRGGAEVVDDLVELVRRGESERLVLETLVKLGDARAIPALEALRACPSISSEVNRALRALRGART